MRAFLFAFISIALLGCQYDPYAQVLTTTEPKAEDILGVYVLDRFELPPGLVSSNLNVEVDLHADGTFTATNVPPWATGVPNQDFSASLITGTGTWLKSAIGTLDPGHKSIWGISLSTSDKRNMAAEFTGEKPPYGLIFEIGDPDSGYAILLRRKQ